MGFSYLLLFVLQKWLGALVMDSNVLGAVQNTGEKSPYPNHIKTYICKFLMEGAGNFASFDSPSFLLIQRFVSPRNGWVGWAETLCIYIVTLILSTYQAIYTTLTTIVSERLNRHVNPHAPGPHNSSYEGGSLDVQ